MDPHPDDYDYEAPKTGVETGPDFETVVEVTNSKDKRRLVLLNLLSLLLLAGAACGTAAALSKPWWVQEVEEKSASYNAVELSIWEACHKKTSSSDWVCKKYDSEEPGSGSPLDDMGLVQKSIIAASGALAFGFLFNFLAIFGRFSKYFKTYLYVIGFLSLGAAIMLGLVNALTMDQKKKEKLVPVWIKTGDHDLKLGIVIYVACSSTGLALFALIMCAVLLFISESDDSVDSHELYPPIDHRYNPYKTYHGHDQTVDWEGVTPHPQLDAEHKISRHASRYQDFNFDPHSLDSCSYARSVRSHASTNRHERKHPGSNRELFHYLQTELRDRGYSSGIDRDPRVMYVKGKSLRPDSRTHTNYGMDESHYDGRSSDTVIMSDAQGRPISSQARLHPESLHAHSERTSRHAVEKPGNYYRRSAENYKPQSLPPAVKPRSGREHKGYHHNQGFTQEVADRTAGQAGKKSRPYEDYELYFNSPY